MDFQAQCNVLCSALVGAIAKGDRQSVPLVLEQLVQHHVPSKLFVRLLEMLCMLVDHEFQSLVLDLLLQKVRSISLFLCRPTPSASC